MRSVRSWGMREPMIIRITARRGTGGFHDREAAIPFEVRQTAMSRIINMRCAGVIEYSKI